MDRLYRRLICWFRGHDTGLSIQYGGYRIQAYRYCRRCLHDIFQDATP